jgi:hypothetical protein
MLRDGDGGVGGSDEEEAAAPSSLQDMPCHANHFILEKSSADRAMRALENSQGPQRRSQLRLAVLRDQELQQHILSSE